MPRGATTQGLLVCEQIEIGGSITLGQLVKVAAVVATGGEGKTTIAAGEVKVNGVVERRRGRRLRSEDIVEVHGRRVRLGYGSRGTPGDPAGHCQGW